MATSLLNWVVCRVQVRGRILQLLLTTPTLTPCYTITYRVHTLHSSTCLIFNQIHLLLPHLATWKAHPLRTAPRARFSEPGLHHEARSPSLPSNATHTHRACEVRRTLKARTANPTAQPPMDPVQHLLDNPTTPESTLRMYLRAPTVCRSNRLHESHPDQSKPRHSPTSKTHVSPQFTSAASHAMPQAAYRGAAERSPT